MEKRAFPLFCVINLIIVTYSVAESNRNYDLDGLMKKTADRYENSLHAQENGVLHQIQFRRMDDDWTFEPSENSSKFSKCIGDVKYIFKNLNNQWAMKFFDSYGKPESGILDGNMKWLGSYHECVNITSSNPNSTFGNFRGQYCTLSISFNVSQMNIPLSFSIAMCLPDSCSPEELQDDVLQLLYVPGTFPVFKNNSGFNFPTISLKCLPRERHLNNAAIAVIALLSFFFALTVAGSSITAFKYFKEGIQGYKNVSFIENVVDSKQLIGDQDDVSLKKENDKSPLQEDLTESRAKRLLDNFESFLICFCVFTNGSKILSTNTSEGELLCIHGIRFLSMCWVILGHAYLFGIMQMKNILALLDYVDTFLFQIILQGFYSVDSFFVLSGFLVAYLVMNEFAKSNSISIAWPAFYIHRYIRLTPIYMIILGFSATVYLYLGTGPYWPDQDIDKNCQDHWWHNLIYINNMYDQQNQCMGWAWYLANDMQFFVISPLFLITLWRWPKIGYSLIGVFMLACWLSNFFITYHFDLMAGVFNISQALTATLTKYMDYFNEIYTKPYTRISPYLIGIVTGYLLHKRRENNSPKHSLAFVCIGWMLSVGIGLTCVFVLYHQNPPLIGNSFYNAFNRTGYSLSLAWVIYACLAGHGGFVNNILSYKFFIPLSRLTYTAYLIHPLVLQGYFSSMKTSMEFNHPTLVYLYLGFLVVTYALSLPVALILESPIISLEKWIRKSFSKKQNNRTVN